MDYYIITSPETVHDVDFPEGLSYFFEQIGGYAEYSMVSQLERILEIDLSIFQNIDHTMECNDTNDPVWQNIQSVIDKISEFKTALNSNADYVDKVRFNKEDPRSRLNATVAERKKNNIPTSIFDVLHEMVEDGVDFNSFGINNSNYPPDTGYLREGKLLKDLNKLEKNLKGLQKKGVEKIKYIYS